VYYLKLGEVKCEKKKPEIMADLRKKGIFSRKHFIKISLGESE